MNNEGGKQALFKGAFILLSASILVKAIGALFKIPLVRSIGVEGMGYFSTAYVMYTFLLVIATAGFPVAISKMVAEARANGRDGEVQKILRVAFVLLGTIGVIGSSALYFGANFFANLVSNADAVSVIRAIAPAVLFISIVSVFRGYYQGRQNMMPTALSEVTEALGKLVIGLALAIMIIRTGNVIGAATGAITGVTAGAGAGTLLIILIYLFSRKNIKNAMRKGKIRSNKRIALDLAKIAIPITIGALSVHLTNLIDMGLIMNRLQASGMDAITANKEYGMYTGHAMTMFNMPLIFVVAIGRSAVPAISGALAMGRRVTATTVVESVLRLVMLFALPCAVGIAVLAEPILELVFDDISAMWLLRMIAPAILFVAFTMISTAILQAYSKVYLPVINMFVGCGIIIVMNYNLLPHWGINSAPFSTSMAYLVVMMLNLFFVFKYTRANVGFKDFLIKPVLAAGAMGVCAYYMNNILLSDVSNSIACILAIGFGGIVYAIALFMLRAIRREDVEMLPKSEKIVPILEKFRLI